VHDAMPARVVMLLSDV